jgi:hypothetical protein
MDGSEFCRPRLNFNISLRQFSKHFLFFSLFEAFLESGGGLDSGGPSFFGRFFLLSLVLVEVFVGVPAV